MRAFELVILSGKGGTGKTTVASSFSVMAENHLIADADVDAPDMWILLNPRTEKSVEFVGKKVPVLLEDKCTGCGMCESACKFDAIKMADDGYPEIFVEKCEGCNACVVLCPFDALEMKDKVVGKWFVSETDWGPMVHARLEPGEENSGKLVTMVKNASQFEASSRKRNLIIMDGPPGTGCPVNSAVAGANFVLLVTEPTPSGLHDLKRVAQVVSHFRVPFAVIINKWDLNPQVSAEIERFVAGMGSVVLGKIPYDEEVINLLRQKRFAIEGSGPASREIKNLWNTVKSKILPKS